MHSGLELLEHNRIEQAIVYFDRAIRLNANDEALQQARRSAIRYLPGRDSYRQGDWQLTIDRLAPIFREDPSPYHIKHYLSKVICLPDAPVLE
ncbi:hypothetical protein L6248_02305, partial [Candidatus Parcubacteria bacterium]|nr:hypothetical protein [Candidatus Parcubacteria bacterium]